MTRFYTEGDENDRTGINQQKTRDEMGQLDAAWSGTLLCLMLTYRALSDWEGMIEPCR